jgi:glycosyltransferase involved in cell wall biosynthesis
MSAERLHVLLPTDVFPPKTGGAGWSAHALATALQARGHRVTAIVPRRGQPGIVRRIERGVPVVEVGYTAPAIPFVQNYYRFELLWPLLRNVILAEAYRVRDLPVVIHAQHAQTAGAAVLAARELERVPALVTVRDAWPWHYFATGLLGDRTPFLRDHPGVTWLDLIGRLGPLKGVLAAPAIPYLRGHLRRRAALLAQADAVIAVSDYVRRKLQPIVAAERLHVIPNLIDVEATLALVLVQSASPQPVAIQPPFLLFVGKLARNKGAHLLPEALSTARALIGDLPRLVIAGDGELADELRRELMARGIAHELLPGWTEHDEVLRLMRRAELLLFPSAWGEPLTRVLIEASAVGACIAAMRTGGTSDIVVHGASGVLASDAAGLGQAIAALLADPARREQLRAGARQIARERFAADVVAGRVEALYRQLLDR